MTTLKKQERQADRYFKQNEKLEAELDAMLEELKNEFQTKGNTKKYQNLKLRAKGLYKLERYYFKKSFRYYFCKIK